MEIIKELRKYLELFIAWRGKGEQEIGVVERIGDNEAGLVTLC